MDERADRRMARDVFELLRTKIAKKSPTQGEQLDEVFQEWWNELDEEERFDVIQKLASGTEIDKMIARCGCNGGGQRCAVGV